MTQVSGQVANLLCAEQFSYSLFLPSLPSLSFPHAYFTYNPPPFFIHIYFLVLPVSQSIYPFMVASIHLFNAFVRHLAILRPPKPEACWNGRS